ncbi:MAG: hypothetical protein NFCOHLIN_02458 [Gammaproteobacteria bacterium]|nr:hypothetical protein [Gammaproteobacteria bacterium]
MLMRAANERQNRLPVSAAAGDAITDFGDGLRPTRVLAGAAWPGGVARCETRRGARRCLARRRAAPGRVMAKGGLQASSYRRFWSCE